MTVSADFSEVLAWADKLDRAPAESDRVIEAAIDKFAPLVLAEQQANVPVRTGDLYDSLAIDRTGKHSARIGAIQGGAAWRAHFIENGTATLPPEPFIRPAGERYRDEIAWDVAAGVVASL